MTKVVGAWGVLAGSASSPRCAWRHVRAARTETAIPGGVFRAPGHRLATTEHHAAPPLLSAGQATGGAPYSRPRLVDVGVDPLRSDHGTAARPTSGTVFKVNTDGSGFALVRSFAGRPADGGTPYGSLVVSGSTLYGVTTARRRVRSTGPCSR